MFDASERFEELRHWLADEWGRGEAGWSTDARAIFEELELVGDGARRRSLLESPAFRRLLDEPPPLAAAA